MQARKSHGAHAGHGDVCEQWALAVLWLLGVVSAVALLMCSRKHGRSHKASVIAQILNSSWVGMFTGRLLPHHVDML